MLLLGDLVLLDEGVVELGVRGSIPEPPLLAVGTGPVQQGGHVDVVMREDVIVLIHKAFKLAFLVVALEL